MFALIFAIIEVIGNIIVEVLKKLFAMALLTFLVIAGAITTIIIVLDHAVG